jgi:hypothetical protein
MYKAFQDWYHEGNIKHLLLHEHNGNLISPPFATNRCKDYNRIMKYDGSISYIETALPPATSKTNCVLTVNGSSWFVPYGIYDDYNVVLELKDDTPIIHTVKAEGKGQFYSGASNGSVGFSFPLGYEGTQYALIIKNSKPELIPMKCIAKAHMGTVYCNNKFYSMPRGDQPGYNNLVSFDGERFDYYHVPVESTISRKYTDLIVVGNKLFSLPFGEQSGLNDVVEFDTITQQISLHKLNVPDFAKKFNSMLTLGELIVGMPYGDEFSQDSNWGVIFNTVTKESKPIDIEITHGGKYRYRCGIEFNDLAVFFPSGTPQCPIIAVDKNGSIVKKLQFTNIMFGRPIIHKSHIHVLAYNTVNETQSLYIFDSNLKYEQLDL